MFALLTYLGACAAALRYRLRGEYVLAVIGGAFCVFVIALVHAPVLDATVICLACLRCSTYRLSRRKYLLPDPTVRTGEL